MDVSFWLKVGASFLVGSSWVTLTTLSAERFGSKVGGLIGGLPSTVVIALLFIGVTQSAEVAAQVTTVMPLAQGLNGLVVLTFMLLIRKGLKIALAVSLPFWVMCASFLYLLNIHSFFVSIVGWLLLLAFCTVAVEKWMKIVSQGRKDFRYAASQLIWRAVFGGSVISLAVVMGKVGGPLAGGIFGSFPAMILSTLVITAYVGGAEYSRAVGKSLVVSGLVNVPLYEIVVRFLYPRVGIWAGTVIAILFSMGTAYLTYLFLRRRMA